MVARVPRFRLWWAVLAATCLAHAPRAFAQPPSDPSDGDPGSDARVGDGNPAPEPVAPAAPAEGSAPPAPAPTRVEAARTERLVVAAPASPPTPPSSDPRRILRRFSLGAELAYGTDEQPRGSVGAFSPAATLRYRAFDRWAAELSWGAASIGDAGADGSSFRAGNPWLAAYFDDEIDLGTFRVGLGITAPVAQVSNQADEGRAQRSVLTHAMALRGLWDVWAWSPDRLAVPLVGRFDLPVEEWVSLLVDAGVAPLFATGGVETGVRFAAQGAASVCVYPAAWLEACGRVQTVFTSMDVDSAQSAVAARLMVFPDTWRIHTSALANVDEPLGGGRGARIWSLSLGREVRWW